MITTFSDLRRAVARGMKADPVLWGIECTVGLDQPSGEGCEYDFREQRPLETWTEFLLPLMKGRATPHAMHTFEMLPPVQEPLLVPMRRPHTLFMKLRLPGQQTPHVHYSFKYGEYKWETQALEDAHAPGWKDYFHEGRLTLMTQSELDATSVGDDRAIGSVVQEIERSQRPHLSLHVRRYVDPDQQKAIEQAAKKPGAASPTFLKLQPEFMAVTRVVLAVDSLVLAQSVVGRLLQTMHHHGRSQRLTLL